jgi:hypothetical protein
MSISVGIEGEAADLLGAVGLLDADGHVNGAWFQDPLGAVRRVLADPAQRAALLALLDELLEADPGAPPGSSWHRLLDSTYRGNVMVTVTGAVVGVAAAVRTPAGFEPATQVRLELPLVDAGGSDVRPIAGTADGPLRLALDLDLGAGAPASALRAEVTVDLEGHAELRVELDGVEVGSTTRTIALSTASTGRDVVAALELLVSDALADITGDAVAEHLLGAIGLDPDRPLLPLDRLFTDPGALRGWLAEIAEAHLSDWLADLSGLLGGAAPEAGPPLRATVVDFGGDARLELRMSGDDDVLRIGAAFATGDDGRTLEASATLLAIPLTGTAPVRVVPEVAVRAPVAAGDGGPLLSPADTGGDFGVQSLVGGLAFDGATVRPELLATGVVFGGVDQGTVDLTDASAVVGVATDGLRHELETQIGDTGPGRTLLSLLGILPPRTADPVPAGADPWPLLDLDALLRGPTRAIADVHRRILADATYSWSSMLDEIGALLELPGTATGDGTEASPWVIEIASVDGVVRVELAAWDAAGGAAADHGLRLGLRVAASLPPWSADATVELLAFDLPAGGGGAVRLVGRHRAEAVLDPVPVAPLLGGVELSTGRVAIAATWTPGLPFAVEASVADIRVTAPDGDAIGPVTLRFPAPGSAGHDLGLGADPALLWPLIRFLGLHALQAWGGDGARAIGSLLGLDARLAPLELPDPSDLGSLFDHPGALLRERLRALLLATDPDSGAPVAERALEAVAALLRSEVPLASEGFATRLDVAVTGTGSYDDPWALALGSEPGEIDVLAWLEPAGPPVAWAAALAAHLSGGLDAAGLLNLAQRARGLLGDLPGTDDGAPGLAALAGWLADGDGVVPLASQVPELAGWAGRVVPRVLHEALPRDPDAIAHVGGQLAAWAAEDGAAAPVLLLGPAWSTHAVWEDLLTALDSGRRAGAHFDLRAGADPSAVTAVAGTYTADLDDGAGADLDALAAQAVAVTERILALTGAGRAVVVAHSTGGLVARAVGAVRPELIRGIVTLATPHAGRPPAPLADPTLADAVRLARDLGGAGLEAVAGEALAGLEAALDGADGAVRAADFVPAHSAFAPGLAIGSALGGDLIAGLADALSTGLGAVAGAPRVAPTHVGLGLRARLPIDVTDAGDVRVDPALRLDAGRVRLVAAAEEPTHPAQALALDARIERRGGWLAGGAVEHGPRIRSAVVGARLTPQSGGGIAVAPRIELHDASIGGLRRDIALGDAALADALEVLLDGLGLDDAAPQRAALEELATSPATALLARRDALLDELGGPVTIDVGATQLELSLDREAWELRVRTASPLALGAGAELELDGRVALRGLIVTLDATLRVGAVELAFTGHDGRLVLRAPPSLAPVTLVPPPPPDVLRDTVVPVVARVVVSSVLTGALGGLLGSGGSVRSLERLFADPGAVLAAPSGNAIQELLQAVARALGLDDAQGLALPGGVLISASGDEAIHLAAQATFGPDDLLTVALTLDIATDRSVAVGGTVTLDITLPSGWNHVTVRFGVTPAGVTLVVTPATFDEPIVLLPHFSGFGPLVEGTAASLLPAVLQKLVDELGPLGPLGQAALGVAGELGVYDAAAGGFTGSAQITRLRAMLQPGWLEQEINDPDALADLVAAVFGPGKIELPAGHEITSPDDLLQYRAQLPGTTGGTLTVEARLGEPITVRVAVADLDLGPLVIEDARAGFAGDLEFALAVRLDPDGDFAFLQPRAELGVDGDRVSAALLPLGEAQRTELALDLAPVPRAVATEAGLVALLVSWGAPLATLLAVKAVGDDVLRAPMWTGGPSPRSVLQSAHILDDPQLPTDPPALRLPLAPLEEIALRGLDALAAGISVKLTDDLTLAVVDDGAGRKGLRLKGRQVIDPDDGPTVDLRFGFASWLEDADAGVTMWMLRPAAGMPPFALDPALDAIGLGVVVGSGDSDPLIPDPPVIVGSLGGLLFARIAFLDATGNVAVSARDLGAALEIVRAKISISSDDGDSFVKKLLPKELAAGFDLAVEGRQGEGVTLHGGIGSTEGAIELTFPLDLDIGGVATLRELFLGARRDGPGVQIVGALSGNAALGPVAMTVDRVGLRVRIGGSGVQVGFKPPDGFGLSIDTSTLRVGGFLLVDEEHGRYVGAVEIAIVQKFSLVAIAIITTKRPDGSEGFALLILIAITFPVPIPLGYGFFFAGAGGLLGINRGIDLDRLRLGLRSGTADSILFPTDIVRRIDTIVRDLDESFPIAEGRFLIAPMAMITWSSPPLVSAKVGLIIEIGSPLRLGILGVLRLALPDPSSPIVDLKVAFLGALDIPGSMLSFDASIYDSYIGYADFKLRLEGDIAFRICWGATPDFVMTVGGFHPSYRPAAHLRLPPMRRMTLSLLKDNPRITLSVYFAVTSNSVQFGAQMELVFEAGGFSIEGNGGFDVLVQIVPFHLEAHIWVRLSVKAGGSELLSINLDLNLEGPTPWIARGKASFKILFVKVEVSLEATMGEAAPAALPTVSVLPKLLDAFGAEAAWSAELSARAADLIALIPPKKGELVLDAAGRLTVRQRLMPLARDISLFGTARPTDVSRVSVAELRVGRRAAGTADVSEAFAPAAFRALTDREKLAAPSFEQMPAGVQAVSGTGLTTDYALRHAVAYETAVYDTVPPPAGTPPVSSKVEGAGVPAPAPERFQTLVRGGAIGAAAGSIAQARRAQQGSVLDVGPATDRWGVVVAGDLVVRNAAGGVTFAAGEERFVPRSAAEARRDALNTGGATTFEILPEAQLVTA